MGMHRAVYLGYGNNRKAFSLTGHNLVTLVDGAEARTFWGDPACGFLDLVAELTHHTCGGAKTSFMTNLLNDVGHGDTAAYNHLFDLLWNQTDTHAVTHATDR